MLLSYPKWGRSCQDPYGAVEGLEGLLLLPSPSTIPFFPLGPPAEMSPKQRKQKLAVSSHSPVVAEPVPRAEPALGNESYL